MGHSGCNMVHIRSGLYGPYNMVYENRYELLKKSKRGRRDRGRKSPPPRPRQPQASEGHISYHGFVRVMKLFMKMPRGKISIYISFGLLYNCCPDHDYETCLERFI